MQHIINCLLDFFLFFLHSFLINLSFILQIFIDCPETVGKSLSHQTTPTFQPNGAKSLGLSFTFTETCTVEVSRTTTLENSLHGIFECQLINEFANHQPVSFDLYNLVVDF